MPFKHLITYTQSLLVHSIYHKYCPSSLHNSWMTNSMRNAARDLRNADDLYIPFARTDHIKKLPYFALPKVWNELTEQKFTPNPTTFKIAIKQHFLSLTNPTSSLPSDFRYWDLLPPHMSSPPCLPYCSLTVIITPSVQPACPANPRMFNNKSGSIYLITSLYEVSWMKTEGSVLYSS